MLQSVQQVACPAININLSRCVSNRATHAELLTSIAALRDDARTDLVVPETAEELRGSPFELTPDLKDLVIVFDDLNKVDSGPGFHDLEHLANVLSTLECNIMLILITSSLQQHEVYARPSVYFRSYTADEVCRILGAQGPPLHLEQYGVTNHADQDMIWERYCKTIYSAFYESVGHDLTMLRIVANQIFEAYMKPVKDNILSAKSHTQLGRAAHELLLSEPWILQEESIVQSSIAVAEEKTKIQHLSECARFLILAAFLASYNPGKTDRLFFSRGKGEKTRKRGAKGVARVEKLPQRLLGPKSFQVERMISIFQAITHRPYEHNVVLDCEV